MVGLIDVGGGMRDVYGAGVTDCFQDKGIFFDLCIGVSAGSANISSFLSGQKGRNYRFFCEYASRKEYMSMGNMIKTGSYIDLDYIYSTLSDEGGEDPIDYDALAASKSEFITVATDAQTGEAVYFDKSNILRNDLWLLKASSAIPLVCKPIECRGRKYFDGGVSDPLPIAKAFEMGCDKVVVIIPRPPAEKTREPEKLMTLLMRSYPNVLKKMINRPEIYNSGLKMIFDGVKNGSVILISPDSDKGLNMLTTDRTKLDAYYKKGYDDALKAIPCIF